MTNSVDPNDSQDELTDLRRRVESLEKLWARLEGGGTTVKILFWIVGPVVTAILFIKDHWK